MAPTISWQEFIAAQRKEEYPLNPKQLSAIESLFSNPNISVSQIAQEIASPVLKWREDNPKARDDNYKLWRTITAAVEQLTEYNDKLVELVFEYQKIPDPTGYIAVMQDAREYWLEFSFDFVDPPSTDPDRAAKRQGWTNLNAFAAKLSTRDMGPYLDMRHKSALAIKKPLEKTPWDSEEDPDKIEEFPPRRAHQLELRKIETLNSTVPAAAVWFTINGKGLYEFECGEVGNEAPWNQTNWKGPKGWSRERFAYWRERFEWISNVSELDVETREAAKEAVKAMKKVEV